jgi:hypothetical protein
LLSVVVSIYQGISLEETAIYLNNSSGNSFDGFCSEDETVFTRGFVLDASDRISGATGRFFSQPAQCRQIAS